jgi:hypothetical protein
MSLALSLESIAEQSQQEQPGKRERSLASPVCEPMHYQADTVLLREQ